MIFFTRLTLVLGILFFTMNSGLAQTMYKYKIVFKDALLKQQEEVKSFLQKYSANTIINNINPNETIFTSPKQINIEILSGKLEKLKAPVKSIDLLDIAVVIQETERIATPVTNKEVQDKSSKSIQKQTEMKPKQIFAEPNRRY